MHRQNRRSENAGREGAHVRARAPTDRSVCSVRLLVRCAAVWGVGVGGRRRRGARRPLWWGRSVPIPLATAAPPRLKFENRPASFVCTSRLIDRSMCTPSVPRFRFSRNNFD
jgi:hypothetical protein